MTKMTAQEAAKAWREAECLCTEQQVQAAYDELARKITEDLRDEDPLVLCVMTGGLIAAGHLLTRLAFPLQIDYIHATRYNNTTQGNELQWLAYPRTSLKGRTVLIIDDIHDVGETLKRLVEHCRSEGAKAVYSAVLVNKRHDRKADFQADYVGLEVGDRYVFGCGMDYRGYLRNAPGIYAVKE